MAKFLTNIDLNKNQLLQAVFQNLTSDPASPVEGQAYANTSSHALLYHDGTSFKQIAILSSTSPAGLTAGGTAVTGTSATAARADHVHALPSNTTASTLTVAGAATVGSSTDVARADHEIGRAHV